MTHATFAEIAVQSRLYTHEKKYLSPEEGEVGGALVTPLGGINTVL